MFKKYIKKITIAVFLLLGVMNTQQAALAIGISPASINVDNMINGQKQAVSMTMMRTDPTGEAYFDISVSGEAARFITLPSKSFYLSADEKRGNYTFYINPVGAANGLHTATVLFTQGTGKTKSDEFGAAIQIGVSARVTFSVTENQIKDYTIFNVHLAAVEENMSPFLTFYIKNSGNIDVRPDRIDYKVEDITDSSNFKTGKITADEIMITPPWEMDGKNVVPLKEGLSVGRYKISVDFVDNGNVKQSFQDLNLQVVPKGTLKQNGEFVSFKLNGDKFANNDLLKFEAVASSIGEATIEPILYIEIKSNDKIIDLIKSDKKSIPPNNSANFVLTHRLSGDGEYEADAYFEYGFQQTEHQKINFSIGDFESAKTGDQSLVKNRLTNKMMVFAAISIILAILVVVFNRFVKKIF